jgi:alkaline phosphatase D
MTTKPFSPLRRRLLLTSTGAAATRLAPLMLAPGLARGQSSAIIGSDRSRPSLSYGLQFGDLRRASSADPRSGATYSAIAWTRADHPGRLQVEWSLNENFTDSRRLPSLLLHPSNDQTGRLDIAGLPAGQRVFVRMHAESLDNHRVKSEPVIGSFITPSDHSGNLRFVWGGDTAGQGWGISPSHGGMSTYRTMREQEPAFFVHSGDTIYADAPISAEQKMPDGSVWKNIVLEEKTKVAETLDEFRANYRYNLMDEHLRRFNHEVPQIWQWDDHEVTNNWSDSKDLSANDRYREKNIAQLAARASQAFLEYAPMRMHGDEERDRIYRLLPHGPLLDLLMIDMRSYRGPNSTNLQPGYDATSQFLGPAQLSWIKRNLKESKATWKVICADMPIGLQVGDGKDVQGAALWEAVANGESGGPLGREIEIADLLAFIRRERIRNVVWLTADVHYCAAHHYSPHRAAFTDFDPFWEFVAGPLHSGAFGPSNPDGTFGLDVVFQSAPSVQNEPPSDGNQFFGQVDIDGQTGSLTVQLKDRGNRTVFSHRLDPT